MLHACGCTCTRIYWLAPLAGESAAAHRVRGRRQRGRRWHSPPKRHTCRTYAVPATTRRGEEPHLTQLLPNNARLTVIVAEVLRLEFSHGRGEQFVAFIALLSKSHLAPGECHNLGRTFRKQGVDRRAPSIPLLCRNTLAIIRRARDEHFFVPTQQRQGAELELQPVPALLGSPTAAAALMTDEPPSRTHFSDFARVTAAAVIETFRAPSTPL